MGKMILCTESKNIVGISIICVIKKLALYHHHHHIINYYYYIILLFVYYIQYCYLFKKIYRYWDSFVLFSGITFMILFADIICCKNNFFTFKENLYMYMYT